MPILNPEPPEKGTAVLLQGMRDAMAAAPAPPGGAAVPGASAGAALPVYTVSSTDLKDGRFLTAAKRIAWKYALLTGDTPSGLATVNEEGGGEMSFARYQTGGPTIPLLEALHVAEGLPETAAKDFKCNFLEIRPLYFSAVWLHAADEDIIIPLESHAQGDISAYSVQTPETILKLLHAKAAQGSAVPPAPESPGE